MKERRESVRLTMTQALVRHLAAQFIEIDGSACASAAAASLFSATAMSSASAKRFMPIATHLPLWRGQNEQSMAMAAVAYAKQKLRKRFMFATASAGPGTTNMLTSAAIAHTNRLPLLLLCGDAYVTTPARPCAAAGRAFWRSDASASTTPSSR